jgi:two-component system response regulator HydG
MTARILVIDDEESIRITLERFLSQAGYEVTTAEDFAKARSFLNRSNFDIVFADILLPDGSGIDILRKMKEEHPLSPVIMITGNPTVDNAAEAVRLGAFDYIPKPVKKDNLLHVAGTARKYREMTNEKEKYRANMDAVFRSVRDAIVSVDRDMKIISMNQAAEDIAGFSRDMIGKGFGSFTSICHDDFKKILEETVRTAGTIEEYRVKCGEGKGPKRILSLTSSPLVSPQGSFMGAVLVVRDETRLDYLEEELQERRKYHGMVGRSKKMQRIYSLIEDLTDLETTVLITGESGTGKELVADAIHHGGKRSEGPLVKVNCSALSENLLESELFGHVKGAFTGAHKDKTGRLEMAQGGTLFFDEIGDISTRVQVRLLRLLQDKEFERVGDAKPMKADVRIVAATHQNLKEKIENGEFREDLYYRLKVVEIAIPPLRERRGDIPALVEHFIAKFNRKSDREIVSVSDEVMELFMDYQWPGNVRELEHAIEHAFVVCRKPVIGIEHLPSELKNAVDDDTAVSPAGKKDYADYEAVVTALKQAGWNKAKAARILGVSRRTIYRKMADYEIAGEKE